MTDASLTYRTHTCGALRRSDVGQSVVLLGWAHRVRDLGGLIFIDLRDRHGLTQVVVRSGGPAAAAAAKVRPEFVIAVHGTVEAREPATVNSKLETGEIEVAASVLDIPAGTFKSRLHYATVALRAALEAEDRRAAMTSESMA